MMIFLFPTEFEAALFRRACPTAEVVVCGVGMAATAAAVSRVVLSRPDRVVLCGIAGAYDVAQNPINQVVEVVRESIEELPQQFAMSYDIEPYFGLVAATSNSVNRSNFIGSKSDIENMEGAAAVAICIEHKIQFSEIRAISNLVGDHKDNWSIGSAIKELTNVLSTIYNR